MTTINGHKNNNNNRVILAHVHIGNGIFITISRQNIPTIHNNVSNQTHMDKNLNDDDDNSSSSSSSSSISSMDSEVEDIGDILTPPTSTTSDEDTND